MSLPIHIINRSFQTPMLQITNKTKPDQPHKIRKYLLYLPPNHLFGDIIYFHARICHQRFTKILVLWGFWLIECRINKLHSHLLCCTKLTAMLVGTKDMLFSFFLIFSRKSCSLASSVASMFRILSLKQNGRFKEVQILSIFP